MAYRSSMYKVGTEDEPDRPASRSVRERSPRQYRRQSPGRQTSVGQRSRQSDRSDNRSCSPDRSSPELSNSRKASVSEQRRKDYKDIERELRAEEAREWNKDKLQNFGERRQFKVRSTEPNDEERNKSESDIRRQIPRVDLEKLKRHQELREKEIKINEEKQKLEREIREKEEHERTTREKMREDAGIGEKQARAGEGKKRQLESELIAPNNSSSLNERGGGVSVVQQKNPSALKDSSQTHQIDCNITSRYPGGISSPQLQSSNPKPKSRSPSSRSVEMADMDTGRSDSRANKRLHLVGLFTQLMAEARHQSALQARRDSSKRILDQKTAAYEKAHIMHREFPSADESMKASKERAQKDFNAVERELNQEEEASTKLIEEISEVVFADEQPFESEQGITDRIKKLEDDCELLKENQQHHAQLQSTFVTGKDKQVIIGSIGDGLASFRQELGGYAAKASSLEAEVAQLRQSQTQADLRTSLEGLTSRTSEDMESLRSKMVQLSSSFDDLQQMRRTEAASIPPVLESDTSTLKSTIDLSLSRIDSLEVRYLELSKTTENVNKTLALQSAAINDRSEMENVNMSLKNLSRAESETRSEFTKLQSMIQSLVKDVRSFKMVEAGRRSSDTSGRDMSILSKDLGLAIHDEIKATQEAVDEVLNQKFGTIEGQFSDIKEQLKPLERQLIEVSHSLNSLRVQKDAQVDRIATDLGSVRVAVNGTREEINTLKQNDFLSLQIAYNNLDYRMNNLSTEHLARQILGQLDAHLRGSEKNIETLELRLQSLERRPATNEVSPVSNQGVEERLQKLRNEISEGLNEHLVQVKDTIVELNEVLSEEQMKVRKEVDANNSEWQNMKGDVQASKTSIAEALSSLRAEINRLTSKAHTIEADLSASKSEFTEATKSLRTDINSIAPNLQLFQDDLAVVRNSCKEANTSLKVEIAKASRSNLPEKRRVESPGSIKTNGHNKRKKHKRSASDSEDEV